jgi:cell division protein FtsL
MAMRKKTRGAPRRFGNSGPRPTLPKGWPAALLLIAVWALAAILQARSKLVEVQLGYQLSEATEIHKDLLAETHKLQLEVATLRSPQRLRQVATQMLGLVEPSPVQILRGQDQRR